MRTMMANEIKTRTDTERLDWLIEFAAYGYLDPSIYGSEWHERDRFALVREKIDIAIDATIDEEEADMAMKEEEDTR